MFKYVAYISEQSHRFSEKEIQELLEKSRSKNSTREITGLLIFLDGIFTQFIEGPAETVNELYESISTDPRHKGLLELTSGISDKRYYSDWTMAYRKLNHDDFVKITGYRELDKSQFFSKSMHKVKHPGIQLLQSFVSGLHFS